jgi:transcriptional regulator with XRE-family HTH domain
MKASSQQTPPKLLGRVIQIKRKQLGYSQESFAQVCRVHRTYMGAIERGERNVALKNLVKIAEALNMKLSELLAEAGL